MDRQKPVEKTSKDEKEKDKSQINEQDLILLFSKNFSIKIKKPLIPLKAALFLWFGASAGIAPFLQVFIKQRGLTISQISIIYMFNPCVQFLGPIISGAIADKTGSSKPVLLGNMFLTTAMLSIMLFIPYTNLQHCIKQPATIACVHDFTFIRGLETCNTSNKLECEMKCPSNESDILCQIFNKTICEQISNTSVLHDIDILTQNENLNESNHPAECCIKTAFFYQAQVDLCNDFIDRNCNFTCYSKHKTGNESNPCDVILDDNTMSMVKTYDSDFGRERFWSILGTLAFSVFSGYAVDMTTREGELKNYNTAIYIFDITACLAALAVCKLEVQIQQPGKQMVKKSFSLLKTPDILAFLAAILILGTCWCFSKQFSSLYLDTLGAPSVLLGLNPALNSLFGLPFLIYSNFWVERLGSGNLLVLGFASHAVFYVGYSYLIDPWWSLPLELTGIFNYHLLWVAVVRHSHSVAPEGLTATVISTSGAFHYAIGKGTGSMLGGMTMSKYGGRIAYKVMAATAGVSGALYALYLFFRRNSTKGSFSTSAASKGIEMASSFKAVTSNESPQEFMQ